MISKKITLVIAGFTLLCLCICIVPVNAEVSLVAAGDHVYYFGEEIQFSGTNDDGLTYLFMMGPGLPAQGARLSSDPKSTPVINGIAGSDAISVAITQPDQTWLWEWPTSETIDLEPSGYDIDTYEPIYNYEVFAVNQPVGYFNLSEPGVYYDTLNISLQWPFITAMASPYIGHIGTVFTFTGIREGSASPAEYVYISVSNNTPPDYSGSLPQDGVNPDDFSITSVSGNNATLAQVWVNADRTWEYDWDTSAIANGALLPGSEYRFFIINKAASITDAMTYYDPPALHYTKLQLLIEGPVTADYTVNISSGMAPLTVEFTDISSGFPSDVWYEFGDGTEANVSAPSLTHTYTSSGMFTPVIHASNSISSDAGTNATIIVGTPPGITPEAAVGDVVDTWYKGSAPPETSLQVSNDYVSPHEVLTLLDGTTITNPLDYTAWVVVTDDDKNANLFHEVCYVFVNADDIRSDRICVMSPPADASSFSYSSQGHTPNPAGRISSQFPPAADPACSPVATNNYALLISGGIDKDHNYIRYYNDIAFLYKTLVKDYKYDKTHIKVLMSDGSANTANDLVASYTTANPPAPVYGNSNTDLDGDGSPETWDPATRTNVLSALGSFSNLGTSANLFIFTTSHGASTTYKADPNTNDVDLYLWGTGVEGKISDTDFVNALPVNPKISMTMEQCNGGGFKDEFIPSSGTKTRILATAARGDKVSKSNDFSYYWITGVAGHDSLGYPANADTTNNGQVSMKEAYDYGNALDPSASLELPQFFDYAGGSGTGQYFSACSATPPGITVTTPSSAWTKGGTYTVTWSRTGTWPSPTPYVKVLLMKGAEPGLVQATISSSKLSSAGSTGASYLVPACLNGGPGTDYWIKIITNAVTPPISGRSSTFSITGVSTCAKTTLWIKSLPDPASLGATIDIKDTNGVPLTVEEHYTNYQYTSVTPGTYYVKLAKTCFYNMLSPQSHTVIAGIPSTRTITLNPMPVLPGGTTCDNSLTGSIAIYSIPEEGYYVYIRSITDPGFTDIGRNTPMIEEIGQGDYIVRLEADGYQSQEKPVTVTAGQQTSVTFELERLPGWSEFSGFYDPIEMGILNSARAGSAIPVKWHLSDADGNDVSDPASFNDLVSYQVDCPNARVISAPSDETKVYPGSSGLQYLKEGNWQLNWKTQKNYAGTCRNMYVEFTSGQKSPEFTFKFNK